MKKKQRIRLNQRREKRIDQNARLQERVKKIDRARRCAFANFEIEVFPPENLKFTPFESGLCYFCATPIDGDDLAAEIVFALRSNKSKKIYAAHREHVYEPDGETPVPEMKKNLTDLYLKIFDAEEGHNFKAEVEDV